MVMPDLSAPLLENSGTVPGSDSFYFKGVRRRRSTTNGKRRFGKTGVASAREEQGTAGFLRSRLRKPR